MSYYERHLPHWHPSGAWLFVTWRLHGSLPAIPEWEVRPTRPAGQAFRDLDCALDRASQGPVWLKDPKIASAVCQTIRGAESRHLCDLGGFVVMINHVHVLLLPHEPAAQVMQWIKGVSARVANGILNGTGQSFWQHESFDHWVRNSRQYHRILRYIEQNPVRAGLVSSPEEWPWSSASRTNFSLSSR